VNFTKLYFVELSFQST